MTDWGVWTDGASWSLDPGVLAPALVAVALYLAGIRAVPRSGRPSGLRTASYLGGVAAVLLALESPLDELAQSLFAAHMVQHMLLLVVAPPLLLAAGPLPVLWRGLPAAARRGLARLARRAASSPLLRRTGRPLGSPAAALALFAADVWAWHLPVLYDLSLRSETVHDLEHTTFLAIGLLFFSHVVDSPPLRSRLGDPQCAALLLGGVLASWLLSLALVFARSPLYAGYAHLAVRPGGGSALADQQLGAGLMWGPGMLPFYALLLVSLRRFIGGEERRAAAAALRRRDATLAGRS